MEKSRNTRLFISCILVSFLGVVSAQAACQSHRFSNNKVYDSCLDLPVLSSYLHWNYTSNGTLDLAFTYTAATTSSWISWAINPTRLSMVGSQALVAYQNSTGAMYAYTTSIKEYRTSLTESDLSFPVPSISAAFSGSNMTIFATLELGSGNTTINQVWQEGPLVNGAPGMHITSGANVQSMATLDLLSGTTPATPDAPTGNTTGSPCQDYSFSSNKVYNSCLDLPVLSSYLHWTYSSNGTVELAFRYTAATTSSWISWAINPTGLRMVGSQALVAYQKSTGEMYAYTTSIDEYQTSLSESNLSFRVPSISATFSGSDMIIFATLELGSGNTKINQVWQEGPLVNGAPGMHVTSGANVQSMGTLDLLSGTTLATPDAPTGSTTGSPCQDYSFSNNKVYGSCLDLPVLSSYLHWTHSSNGTVELAFRYTAATTSSWISWAINPAGLRMVGSQALVAYQKSTGEMHAYTTSIDEYQTSLTESNLSFRVPSISATLSGSDMIIFATLELGSGNTTINQVWQEGPLVNGVPGTHSTSGANVQSMGTLDLVTGATTASGGNSRQRRRNVHGVLNAVSWGTLMPMGALIARYLKVFSDPAWFYLHISCQTSAYIVGVAGWATGLKLGKDSSADNDVHGNIGIVLFALGTLQVFALLLRPKKDHKYRLYWNIYHHLTGYTVIILSIINVFKGLDILDPEKKWKRAYIGILIFFGANVAILEPLTWYIVLKRKASGSDKFSHSMNGRTNGHANGTSSDGV